MPPPAAVAPPAQAAAAAMNVGLAGAPLVARGAIAADDELRRAIEMSLQESVPEDSRPQPQEQAQDGPPPPPLPAATAGPSSAAAAPVPAVVPAAVPPGDLYPLQAVSARDLQQQQPMDQQQSSSDEESTLSDPEEFVPLTKEVIDDFTNQALAGCLTLLDTLPETIYRVCDLMLAVFQRNGDQFKENVLRSLVEEVHKSVEVIAEALQSDTMCITGGKKTSSAVLNFFL